MQKISRTALAGKRTASHLLLYDLYAAKSLDMKCHDIVRSQIAIELFRYKVGRRRLVRFYSVNDEIEVLRKGLDLGRVSRLEAILDRQVMKFENIKKQLLDLRYICRIFATNVDPYYVRRIGEQVGQVLDGKTLFDVASAVFIWFGTQSSGSPPSDR
jgi:hypothetical protein